MTFASSAGQVGAHRRGLVRFGPFGLIAFLALIAGLAFTSTASAADGPPIISPVTVDELGYTTAKVSGTTESDAYYGGNNATLYCFEYALASDPVGEEKWGGGTQACYSVFGPDGKALLSDELIKLKPDTTYQVRLGAFNGYGPEGFSHRFSPEPYTTFTTKPVNKPSGTLAISNVTLNTARISGIVNTNAPPGPLDAAQKAAYRTEWQIVCRPSCQFGAESSTGVLEGDETSQPFVWDTIRLETNTYYEVELIMTNADGGQTAIVEDFFSTPNIAPKITPAPGGSSGVGAYSIGGLITPYNTKITDCHFEYGPTTEYVYSAPCSPQPVGRNEVQAFTIGATAGDFRLTFRGQTTGDIELGGDPANVEKELEALSTIGPEGVTEVTREYGFFTVGYTVHFGGPLSGTNLGPLRASNGTQPVYIPGQQPAPPTCCTGSDLGFAIPTVEGGNNNPVVVEADLTGLTPGATYHYKVFATNNVGTVTTEDIRFVAPPEPAEEKCPNEGVRIENNSTGLPECRAYELVTSAFTAGYGAEMGLMSINEGTVSYTSRAGNINNSGYGGLFNNSYVAVRGEDGWNTIANLNGPRGSLFAPPNNFSTAYGPNQYSSDLLRSLWFLNRPGEPFSWTGTPYLRESDGSFLRISDTPLNHNGLFTGPYMGASEDLTHTFWVGDDYNQDIWAPGVGNGLYQFVGTGTTGLPSRIDLHENGTPISDCSAGNFVENAAFFNKYSADGKTVWFTVKECEGHTAQIWVRVDMEKTYFASESQCTRTAGDPGGACNEEMSPSFERMSRDASRAVFTTNQQLLNSDTDQTRDLYQYILPTAADPNPSPNLIQVSGAAPDARVRNSSAISNDGRRVYFIAQGVLASNHDAHDEPPLPNDYNLYLWEQTAAQPNGVTKFVARLVDFPAFQNDVENFNPRISADGRYMVFTAYHPMVPTDTDNSIDVYRYDAVTGEMTRISVDKAGVGGNADFSDAGFGFDSKVLSDDGQQVVFTTGEALSPEDGNGAHDAYLWQEGRTTLISTGAVGGGAGSVVIDGSGDNIYITSSQQLTADDIDSVTDVYSVHRGGGFSFKELPPCSGEGCQPASAPAPDNGAPATDGPGGEGNYRPATISIRAMSSSQRAKLVAGGEAEVPLKVSGPGKISLKGSTRIRKQSSKVIDAGSRAVQAGVVKVPVTLSRRALSQLRRGGALSVRLSAVIADSETATAMLKLKTAEARRKRSKKGNG